MMHQWLRINHIIEKVEFFWVCGCICICSCSLIHIVTQDQSPRSENGASYTWFSGFSLGSCTFENFLDVRYHKLLIQQNLTRIINTNGCFFSEFDDRFLIFECFYHMVSFPSSKKLKWQFHPYSFFFFLNRGDMLSCLFLFL